MKQYLDSHYYITETGEVYSKSSGKLKKIKTTIRTNYSSFSFCYKGVIKYKTVHRLVAELYIPNPNNFPDVNHINGIKTDNRVENLEWVTKSMNVKHRFNVLGHKGRKGIKHHKAKLTEEQVKYIRENYIPYHNKFNQIYLAKKFNVDQGTISHIINNENWQHI